MNEGLKVLTERRSCRSYLPDPIPTEILDQILEAGTFAATGMGKQSPIIHRDALFSDLIRHIAVPVGT